MTAQKAQVEIVEALANVARSATPRDFQSFLGGIIGNVVGNMTEDYWQKFRKIEPCGIDGCNCHLFPVPILMNALEAMREDHQNFMAKADHFAE